MARIATVSRVGRLLSNAFFSEGRRLFGLRFSRDYLRFAWRAGRNWGYAGPGELELLGHRLSYPNQSHALFLLHELFVHASYAFESPSAHPRIIDCGANIGMAVIFFNAFKPGAQVTAFEPDPVTYAQLARMIELNNLTNVRAVEAAVGGTEGIVELYTHADAGGLRSSTDRSWGGEVVRRVRAVRLSDQIRDPIDFLKIDVEGAEYEIFKDLIETGAINWIAETAIEYHELDPTSRRAPQLRSALQAAGFEVRTFPSNAEDQTGLIRARRRSSPSSAGST